mgnify:CR=1 FL=1
MKTTLAGALLLVAAAPAVAQDAWDFSFTPYVWVPGLTTSVHTRYGTVQASTSEPAA